MHFSTSVIVCRKVSLKTCRRISNDTNRKSIVNSCMTIRLTSKPDDDNIARKDRRHVQ
jgi:hypothetical protein